MIERHHAIRKHVVGCRPRASNAANAIVNISRGGIERNRDLGRRQHKEIGEAGSVGRRE
jgi:hypothetical protein